MRFEVWGSPLLYGAQQRVETSTYTQQRRTYCINMNRVQRQSRDYNIITFLQYNCGMYHGVEADSVLACPGLIINLLHSFPVPHSLFSPQLSSQSVVTTTFISLYIIHYHNTTYNLLVHSHNTTYILHYFLNHQLRHKTKLYKLQAQSKIL